MRAIPPALPIASNPGYAIELEAAGGFMLRSLHEASLWRNEVPPLRW